jgi:DNA-binding NarL/FixJ family response regulator
MRILLVSRRRDGLAPFREALAAAPGVALAEAGTSAEALAAAGSAAPDLAVIDEGLDRKPLELVADLIRVNALINTAVLSTLPEEEFHAASEGLGVLCRLPRDPSAAEALDLAARVRGLGG